MLPKKLRLPPYFIDKLKRHSKRLNSKSFVLLYKKNDSSSPRFAVIVSTKVSKKAVIRNKAKRQIKNLLKSHYDKFGQGDFLIICKKGIIDGDCHLVEKELLEAVEKTKL